MRISDWSSDVCSSDLDQHPDGVVRPCIEDSPKEARRPSLCPPLGNEGREKIGDRSARDGTITATAYPLPSWNRQAEFDDWLRQIGRESCRERVCQYV